MAVKLAGKIEIKFNNFPKYRERIKDVDRAIEDAAIAIEQDVKGGPHAAPYRTGNLRRSYHHRKVADLAYIVENDPGIAPYAIFVEFGTRKMAPRPHLRPALEAEKPRVNARIKEILK